MASWVYVCGLSSIAPIGATSYFPLAGNYTAAQTTEAPVQATFRGSYTLENLYARVRANTMTAATAVKSRVNLADGAQSVSVTAATTGEFEDATNTDSIVDGDEANYSVLTPSGSGAIAMALSMLVTGDNPLLIGGEAGSSNVVVAAGATAYFGLGLPAQNATEANTQYTFRTASTLSDFRFYISSNSVNADSTIRTRLNAANGGQSVLVGSLLSGAFEDTSGTDSVAVGDEVNYQVVAGAGGTSITVRLLQLQSASLAKQVVDRPAAVFAADRFRAVEGGIGGITTESDVQVDARIAHTARNFYSYVSANTTTAATLALRKGAADTALKVSYASGETGVKEDADTESIAATDALSTHVDLSSGSSITIQLYGYEMVQVVGAQSNAPRSIYYHLVGGVR